MLNKETVKNWLNKNGWLILGDTPTQIYRTCKTSVSAMSPLGVSVTFYFDENDVCKYHGSNLGIAWAR